MSFDLVTRDLLMKFRFQQFLDVVAEGQQLQPATQCRARQLLDVIGAAMGKTIGGRDCEELIKECGGPLLIPGTDAGAFP